MTMGWWEHRVRRDGQVHVQLTVHLSPVVPQMVLQHLELEVLSDQRLDGLAAFGARRGGLIVAQADQGLGMQRKVDSRKDPSPHHCLSII